MTRTRVLATALALAAGLGLAGCATLATPGSGDGDMTPVGVRAQGTVIQVGDALPQICLGAVAESYPPQCTGPEVTGWDWSTVGGSETSGETTWGVYAVAGFWDGTTLAAGSAIELALYDPVPVIDPATDPANAGASTDAELAAIQETIATDSPVEVYSSWPENGYLFVQVLFDGDGAVQAWADETYGPDVVQVRSAMRPAPEVGDAS